MRISVYIFYVAFFAIFSLLFIILYRRFILTIKSNKTRKRAKIFFYTALLVTFIPPYLYRNPSYELSLNFLNKVMLIHYLVMGFLSYFIVYTFFWGGLEKFILLYFRKKNINGEGRRDFLKTGVNSVILGTAGFSTLWASFKGLSSPKVKNVFVPVENFSHELDDFSIALISDVHIGPTLDKQFLEGVVSKINQLNPSIIAITGDLIDGKVQQIKSQLVPFLKLKNKDHIYFVTGNHEYYWNDSEWNNFLPELNFQILENSNKTLNIGGKQILIAGVPDYRMALSSDPHRAIKGGQESDLKILLAHQPKSCFQAQKAGFDLQLSGHTHGGQFFPWTKVIHFFQPYVQGLNDHKGMWVYVNTGTGFWGPPLRTGNSAEITHIKFKPKKLLS